MSGLDQGRGWLPAEALAEERDAESTAAADALLALAPGQRVVELMRLAAAGAACERQIRPADLARVLMSFDGEEPPAPETLARLFPGLLLPDG